MRIAALADIHADKNRPGAGEGFGHRIAGYLGTLGADVLVVPGDAANLVGDIIELFLALNESGIPRRLYVPGNHDIWVGPRQDEASWAKYREILPAVCRETGWHYLPGNPLVVDGVYFAGTMGWYDYSTANPRWADRYGPGEYRRRVNEEGVRWMDAEYARFGMDDGAVSRVLRDELSADLGPVSARLLRGEAIRAAVVATHMVPWMRFIAHRDEPVWDYFGAFIGDAGIGTMIDSLDRSLRRVAFFGHTHFPGRGVTAAGVEAHCVPLGYPSEWGGLSLEDSLRVRVGVVEL